MRHATASDRRPPFLLSRALLLPAAALALVVAPPALAHGGQEGHGGRGGGACQENASAALRSCNLQAVADLWSAAAVCAFDVDWGDKKQCLSDAFSGASDARSECRDVDDARLALCSLIGPDPYAPDFAPANFDSDFTALTNPNPYLPLQIGDRWRYESEDEENIVEITPATKRIEGVTCLTVHDTVASGGFVTEDTQDWEAQGKDGSVWYCGELSKTLEVNPGDDPVVPELVDLEGSWKTGRDDAKPGILMQASPTPGTTYRQEYKLDDAEDAATVVSNDWSYGNGEGLDDLVPQALADHFCSGGDCVVIREFAPIEPDANELKYYAPGVGLFLEVDLTAQSINALAECNFHPLCTGIPAP